MARNVQNSYLSFARNIILVENLAVTKFATSASHQTLGYSVEKTELIKNIYEI
jgi:hypothetical protein